GLGLEVGDLLLGNWQISFAVCTTRSSLHRCSSCVPQPHACVDNRSYGPSTLLTLGPWREGKRPSAPHRIRRLQLSRGKFLRIDDHLRAGFLELINPPAFDILILHPHHPRLLPFAVLRI